jgi:Uma2 family endonuclease
MSVAPDLLMQFETDEWLVDESLAPDISHLITEDDTPVDNIYSSKKQRMFIEPLYTAPPFDRPFLAEANVAIYSSPNQPPIVPDMFLSLDVTVPDDWYAKRHRSYLIWEFGKAPEVVIEIVSNREGKEDSTKMQTYARIGVRYYVIYDPTQQLSNHILRIYELRGMTYMELDRFWLEGVGLGLVFWQGVFEQKEDRWLRWCDENDVLVPTGEEERARAETERARADSERTRADSERSRAERLAEQLRKLGLEPEV